MVHYRWLDYFAKQYRLTRCEVLSANGKTAMIRLLGFGRNGTPPGTEMRVHIKSLVGFTPPEPPSPPSSKDWRDYSYFN